MTPYILKKHLTRRITFLNKNDPQVPAALFSAVSKTPDLSKFPYPLPSAKSEYTCSAEGDNSVMWYGGKPESRAMTRTVRASRIKSCISALTDTFLIMPLTQCLPTE